MCATREAAHAWAARITSGGGRPWRRERGRHVMRAAATAARDAYAPVVLFPLDLGKVRFIQQPRQFANDVWIDRKFSHAVLPMLLR